MLLTCPASALADAASARAEISQTCVYIETEIAAINQLAAAKNMDGALQRLTTLNSFISQYLPTVFYDRVQEVLREDPGYTPPAVTAVLGSEFAPQFWEAKVQTAETSLQNAVDALKGVAAMRALDSQDQAFAYLKIAKDTFSSVKDVVEDIATVNFVGLAKDFYDGTNDFIDNYKLVEEANLASLETDAFVMQVGVLARKTEKNLERMKDLKSALIVFGGEARGFELHIGNIARYVSRAQTDPVFPLDFNSALYNFDPTPYTTSIDSLKTSFLAGEFCWTMFEKIYLSIRSEAQAEKDRIALNITNSDEPAENKNVYLIELDYNWTYFDTYSSNMFVEQDDIRAAAAADYDTLLQAVDAKKTRRQALITSYRDKTGLSSQALRTFIEEDLGIVNLGCIGTDTPDNPYFLTREYDSKFPTSLVSSVCEMPEQTPDISSYSLDEYPQGLAELAGAYRVMAEAALVKDSALIYQGSGNPAARFAVSPLTAGLMADVEYNLTILRDQAFEFESFMDAKRLLIDEASVVQSDLETAEQALIDHVSAYGIYLCMDALDLARSASTQWDALIIPVLITDWRYEDNTDAAVAAADGHLAYIQGQNAFNSDLTDAADLLQQLADNRTLNDLLSFIIGDYDSLPTFPSEQGYLDFLTELEYLHSFYGPADLDRVMDLREKITALFKNVYSDEASPNGWFSMQHPYCVMPENLELFQNLFSGIGIWPDRHIPDVRSGFPGWDAWARAQLAEFWPETHTDDIRPNVIHFTPGRNCEDVSLYPTFTVTFNEPMDETGFTGETVRIEANQTLRSATYAYDTVSHTLTVRPGRLLPATVYTITLTDGLTDLAGNPLVPESWSVTTETVSVENLVAITVSGVEDGGVYPDAVTIGISVSAGSYAAAMSVNGEPAQTVISGQSVSRRGRYVLTVTADSGISRTLSFVIGTDTSDYEIDDANVVTMAPLPDTLIDEFQVEGRRYYYPVGGTVYMYDMLTGEKRELFDSGYYYDGIFDQNERDEYASFLNVHDNRVLYFKNIGSEGEGVPPEDKTFHLFVYDVDAGEILTVPMDEAACASAARLRNGVVVWIDDHTGTPAIYTWTIGDVSPTAVYGISGLETWQTAELMGFDGQWVLWKTGDGNNYDYQDTDPDRIGPEYSVPKGESLHAVHIDTLESRVLIPADAAQPFRISSGDAAQGLAACVVYQSHRVVSGGFWVTTCDSSHLYLINMASGARLAVSRQPDAASRLEMSESLLYYVDRVNPPPYSMDAITYFSDLVYTIHDLFTHREQVVDFGGDLQLYADAHLFGDRLITDDAQPRVMVFGKPLSAVSVTDRFPVEDSTQVALDASIHIVFSDAMNPDTLTSEFIALSRMDEDGSLIERVGLDIAWDDASNVLTLTPEALVSASRYRVYVGGEIEDAQGNALVKPLMWEFATEDKAGPVLLCTTPEAGADGMTPSAPIRLHFDEKIDSASAAAGVRLLQGTVPVAFTASAGDNGDLTLTPNAALSFNTEYTVEINTALTDMSGNGFDTPTSFTFTTVSSGTSTETGTLVYYTGMGISTIDADGQNSEDIASDIFNANALRWSPDGLKIYLLDGSLQVMNANGTERQQIDSGLPYYFIPGFSPDGTRILYPRQRPGLTGYELISNSLSGGDPLTLYENTEHTISTAVWSPDGTRIAFVIDRGYVLPLKLGVLVLASGEVTSIEGFTSPVWSPDGTRLLAQGHANDITDTDGLVSFSPDLSGAAVICPITPGAAYLSPSGQLLAVYGSDAVRIINTGTGNVVQSVVCNTGMMGIGQVIWAVDESGFLFNTVNGDWSPCISFFDLTQRSVAGIACGSGMPAIPMDWHQNRSVSFPPDVFLTVEDLSTADDVRIRLDWTGYAKPVDVTQFRIYRSQSPLDDVAALTPLTATTGTVYDDTTATSGQSFYYAVVAVTADGRQRAYVTGVGPVVPGDNDGLDDAWETLYFNGLTAGPDDDPDSDGLTNAQECLEYTDPTNPDTDGDLAPDSEELARGMNPLLPDVVPLTLTAPSVEVEIGETLALMTAGGSGTYAWEVTPAEIASVDEAGQCRGLAEGTVSVMARDRVFTGLVSDPLTVDIVARSFAVIPAGPVTLQKNGYLVLEAVGGSGFYQWGVSNDQVAVLIGFGAARTLTAVEAAGQVVVTVTDLVRTDLEPVTVDVTIGIVPGDVTGDSRVTLDDAVASIQILSGITLENKVYPEGDVNGDSLIGLEDAVHILKIVAE